MPLTGSIPGGSAANWLESTHNSSKVGKDYMHLPRISACIGSITESATLAVDAKAKALKAAGRPVIGFALVSRLPDA